MAILRSLDNFPPNAFYSALPLLLKLGTNDIYLLS